MTNELSKERAIEALYTVRAYYASLTAGYPKGKDCRGIGDVMCSEIANACLMGIQALESQPCEDAISRKDAIRIVSRTKEMHIDDRERYQINYGTICDIDLALQHLPSVTPQPKVGKWLNNPDADYGGGFFICSECGAELYEVGKYCSECGSYNADDSETLGESFADGYRDGLEDKE